MRLRRKLNQMYAKGLADELAARRPDTLKRDADPYTRWSYDAGRQEGRRQVERTVARNMNTRRTDT